MQFNSISFLFCFLPLFLIAFYILPRGLRSTVLILGSFLFYMASGFYWWSGLLVFFVIFTYFAGRSLVSCHRWFLLGIYFAVMGGSLVFLKLYEGGRFLPAGMSFYLFQMAAYLIDVCKAKLPPETRFLDFTAQMTMFPKLLSGPLVDPVQLKLQQENRKGSFDLFHAGLQELILGLCLKVLLANRLGGLWAQGAVVGYSSISTPAAWLILLAYSMKLYFDFWGYSLMAVGLGKMLGYELPGNFDDPYASRSVSEFYRRWHITLGAWFREYVYFPLGGSRQGRDRTVLNLAIVWIFTGLWHGTGGNYLVWAGLLCVFIISEHLFLGKYLKKSVIISHIYTVFAILLSWVPFAVGDWHQMQSLYCRLFGISGSALNPSDFLLWARSYVPILLAGILLLTPYPGKLWRKFRDSTTADILLFFLFWAVVYFISTAAQDPFMYFQY